LYDGPDLIIIIFLLWPEQYCFVRNWESLVLNFAVLVQKLLSKSDGVIPQLSDFSAFLNKILHPTNLYVLDVI
jgi:hypothetical protein